MKKMGEHLHSSSPEYLPDDVCPSVCSSSFVDGLLHQSCTAFIVLDDVHHIATRPSTGDRHFMWLQSATRPPTGDRHFMWRSVWNNRPTEKHKCCQGRTNFFVEMPDWIIVMMANLFHFIEKKKKSMIYSISIIVYSTHQVYKQSCCLVPLYDILINNDVTIRQYWFVSYKMNIFFRIIRQIILNPIY